MLTCLFSLGTLPVLSYHVQWNPDFPASWGKGFGLNYQEVKKMGCKITVFEWGREGSFGSNYQGFSKTESSTERFSSFLDHILQPIAKTQKS